MPEPAEPITFERWSPDGRFAVVIRTPAMNAIVSACRGCGGDETGGILVGKYTTDRRVAIVAAASAKPGSSRSGRSWFVRGVAGLHEWLDRLWRDREGYYLGEWHFHPGSDPAPSTQDAEQLLEIACAESYQCAVPLLVIVGGDAGGPYALHAEVFTRTGFRQQLTEQGNPRRPEQEGRIEDR